MTMFAKRICLLVAFSLGMAVLQCVAADWPAIPPEDQAMTSLPQQPNAPAVILYRNETTDDMKSFRTIYVRLKVLTEAGLKYAEVEIPNEYQNYTISQLSGRTVHADGRVIPLEDQAVDKIVIKEHGVRARVKAFTLPAVQVGSILDYRYSLHFPEGSRNAPIWMVQTDLFSKKSIFSFTPSKYAPKAESLHSPAAYSAYSYQLLGDTMGGGPNGEYASIPYLPGGKLPQEHEGPQGLSTWIDLDMSNIPPINPEPDMPPGSSMHWRVEFFYINAAKPEEYWRNVGKAWAKNIENFLGKTEGVSEAVNQLVATGDSPEIKVQKIYAAVAQMQNESYAIVPREASAYEAGVKDVLQRHSGTHDELNRLFVAMVRAAGIPATMMWLPDRGKTTFNPHFTSIEQLDAEVAVVKLGGQDVFLDPGTKFCPYGIQNWHYAGSRGLRLNGDKSAELADSPPTNYKQAVIQRVARLQLADNGTMHGTLAVGFSGQEAMNRRQAGFMNVPGRKKLLEDEVRSWLPAGSEVSLTNTPEWEKTEGMLVAKFDVKGPLATKGEQGWDFPAHVLQANEKPRFVADQRVNPVYFDYATRRIDEAHISLPPDISVNTLPPATEVKRDYALYTAEQKREGANGVVATRDLAVNGVLFAPTEYKDLKDFYDKVNAGDERPVVLKGELHAQNK